MKIVLAGAGSIGCFCGGILAANGHDVTLLGREYVLEPIRTFGLTVTDFSGMRRKIPASQLALVKDPACMAAADLIVVTVKSAATREMARLISRHAPANAAVLSWQNGMENVRILRAELPGRDVRAGMVPFNVVPLDHATYHRATSGDIVIEGGGGALAEGLSSPTMPVSESDQIEKVQWGKLVINLNNALNALSGLTLQQQLLDRDWRRLMADQMAEALRVLKAAGHPVGSTTPLPASLTPHILRLPTALFSRIASRMLTIDPSARTSMAYDLSAGRPTEIDSLQGEIIRIGLAHGVPAPLNARVAELVRQSPTSALTVAQIRG